MRCYAAILMRRPRSPLTVLTMGNTKRFGIDSDRGGPYPFRESIVWLWRNIRGVRKTNPCGIQTLPRETILNPIRPRITLGVVGDIMAMGRHTLHIAADVRLFFQGCDCLIGNMEGTVTGAGKPSPGVQRHNPSILDVLAGLFHPGRTFLCVANNHAGDYPAGTFKKSINYMRDRGFHVFGLRKEPFADIADGVRVVGASMWSNRPCGEIAFFDVLDGYSAGTAAFCMAYPHWGYELEMFPRPAIVQAGEDLLSRYDAVLGHHSHVPQPLSVVRRGDAAKLLAFSLGDFCTGLRLKKFQYGIVCKVEIGPGENGIWRIGALRWRYTRVSPGPAGSMQVRLASALTL
jgi:hypothetical protein